jgi:hypothetical protein
MSSLHPIPEEAVRSITDQQSLLRFLNEHLEWQLPDNPVMEEVTFQWDVQDLKVSNKTAERLQDGTVYQLRPMVEDQPWGIFLIEFNSDRVYKTDLRNVLRGLVPKRRRDSALPAWHHENILFICLTRNNEFTIANFRGEKPERARLIRFIWSPDDPIRTLCEYNLPTLRMPDNVAGWTEQWHRAFDVEKVTKTFFEEYNKVFEDLRKDLVKQSKNKEWAHSFALHILNRVLFLYFIQKKRWLGNDPRFMKSLWDAYKDSGSPKDTFYKQWLSVLFFEAFNNKYQNRAEYLKRFPRKIHEAFSQAPYLNGGLFSESELDDAYDFTITDSFFTKLFDRFEHYNTGFLERYNFTITEETPLDQEVAVDPEMIGKVYESLVNITFEGKTDEDRRGTTGIFYTPRVEIDLMCRLSLTDWLVNNLGEENKTVIRRAVLAYSPEEKKETDAALTDRDLWVRINDLLNTVTILDIAVGSGSFLVGMLLVIDDLKMRANKILGNSETAYQRRKKIIGRSLYGVDVMGWAVHVAELRLWLQLVVETDLKPGELTIEPLLPNLSFNVRSGDSLVQEIGGINFGLYGRQTGLSPAVRGKLTALKGEKLKFYYGEHKNPDQVKKRIEHDEFVLFSLILREKADALRRKIAELAHRIENPDEVHWEQLDLGLAPKKKTAQQLNIFIAEWEKEKEKCEVELSQIKNALDVLKRNQSVPFVWDIGFVEIFEGEKKGFDIVIGNPPYVRQEKISDPKGMVDKKSYKEKLHRSVYEAYPEFFRYKRTQDKALRKIDGKSDLYIYFYFHGLSLLNDKGSFCFITSNSWLDVGYGKDLQEFLLKNVKIKYIIDNEAKRSFASADINTIICLLSAPFPLPTSRERVREGSIMNHHARFVMFRVSFDQALSPVIFEEIDKASDRLSREEFRVVVRKQDELLREGIEVSKDGEPVKISIKDDKFSGDKWGGKYLRAPDIFFTILEKGKNKLVRLGDIAEVRRGFTTGANEFFYLDDDQIGEWGIEKEFLKPVIKSPRECKSILVDPKDLRYKVFICNKTKKELRGTRALKYIEWGENQGFNKRPSCRFRDRWWNLGKRKKPTLFINKGPWERHFLPIARSEIFCDQQIYEVELIDSKKEPLLQAVSNSTLSALFFELNGRSNFGEGILWIAVYEAANIFVLNTPEHNNEILKVFGKIIKRKIGTVYEECGIDNKIRIRSQMPKPLPDRKVLDDFIFNILSLSKAERNEVYWSVCELVHNRLMKARSV